MNVLLSVRPKYAEAIVKRRKQYEFRKSVFCQPVDRIYIYVTKPVMRVVGSFRAGQIIGKEPHSLWQELHEYSGLSVKDFFSYYEGSKIGYAIEIKDLEVFESSIDPKEVIPDFIPPRSFTYVDGQFSSAKARPKPSLLSHGQMVK